MLSSNKSSTDLNPSIINMSIISHIHDYIREVNFLTFEIFIVLRKILGLAEITNIPIAFINVLNNAKKAHRNAFVRNLRALFAEGANPNENDLDGTSVLHWLITIEMDTEFIMVALSYGANPYLKPQKRFRNLKTPKPAGSGLRICLN